MTFNAKAIAVSMELLLARISNAPLLCLVVFNLHIWRAVSKTIYMGYLL